MRVEQEAEGAHRVVVGPALADARVGREGQLRVARVVEPFGREREPRIGGMHAGVVRSAAGLPSPENQLHLMQPCWLSKTSKRVHEDAARAADRADARTGPNKVTPWTRQAAAPSRRTGSVAADDRKGIGRVVADAAAGVDDRASMLQAVAVVDRAARQ